MSDQRLRDALVRASVELNGARNWPFEVTDVVRKLGLKLRVEARHPGRIQALLTIGIAPTITLYRGSQRSDELNGSERFSLAHEVGHWVLWRRAGAVPAPGKSYWEHEALCNYFASDLLVPPPRVETFVAALRKAKVKSVFFPGLVARSAKVSWTVAARAITSVHPRLRYLRLRSVSASRLFVCSSSLQVESGSFLGLKSYVRSNELISTAADLRPGEKKLINVSFSAGKLKVDESKGFLMRELGQRDMTYVLAFGPDHSFSEQPIRGTAGAYEEPTISSVSK
jgi:hypothetical protein